MIEFYQWADDNFVSFVAITFVPVWTVDHVIDKIKENNSRGRIQFIV